MDTGLLYAVSGIWITMIGLRGLLVERSFLRRSLAASVMGTGIFLSLVAMAKPPTGQPPDPVPHGMVLTGLVISVSAIGLLLALLGRLRELEADEESRT